MIEEVIEEKKCSPLTSILSPKGERKQKARKISSPMERG